MLIQCKNCGQMVQTNSQGRCPKCKTPMCSTCGQPLQRKDIECPVCGSDTVYRKKKIVTGYILLLIVFVVGIKSSFTDFRDAITLCIDAGIAVFCLIIGLVLLFKYRRR